MAVHVLLGVLDQVSNGHGRPPDGRVKWENRRFDGTGSLCLGKMG